MDAVAVDGLRITYERRGCGHPVLLLHGYVGDGPTTWRPQLDALSDELDVIAIDLPGAGGSDDPPEHFGMRGFADAVAGFIDALALDSPHVVGLSFGGATIIELCRSDQDLVSRVVLVGAYAGWGGSLPPHEVERRRQQAFELSVAGPEALVDALLPTMFAPSAAAATVDAFGRALAAFHPAGLRAMAHACVEDLTDVLPHIDRPTLLVYGEEDTRAPAGVARALREAIAGAELVELPGAGHVCNVDAADPFNEAVRRFLLGGATGGASTLGYSAP